MKHPDRPWKDDKFADFLDEVFVRVSDTEGAVPFSAEFHDAIAAVDFFAEPTNKGMHLKLGKFAPGRRGSTYNYARFWFFVVQLRAAVQKFPDLSLDALRLLAECGNPDAQVVKYLDMVRQGKTEGDEE